MNRIIIATIIISALLSCSLEQNKAPLTGEWDMISWKVKSSGKEFIGYTMDFNFKADNRYSVDYGSEIEEGTWRVSGNNLFTHQDGMAEKMVKITHLEGDTLRFEMNRSGQLEQVTLVKK